MSRDADLGGEGGDAGRELLGGGDGGQHGGLLVLMGWMMAWKNIKGYCWLLLFSVVVMVESTWRNGR